MKMSMVFEKKFAKSYAAAQIKKQAVNSRSPLVFFILIRFAQARPHCVKRKAPQTSPFTIASISVSTSRELNFPSPV